MTITFLAVGLCFVFATLGFVHVYWAAGGACGKTAAVPQIKGRPAFVPSRGATFAVAGALFACAVLVALVSHLLPSPFPHRLLVWASYGLALVFFARAIGDFRFVGFFKARREGTFARLDTLAYSPLCLALAICTFAVTLTI